MCRGCNQSTPIDVRLRYFEKTSEARDRAGIAAESLDVQRADQRPKRDARTSADIECDAWVCLVVPGIRRGRSRIPAKNRRHEYSEKLRMSLWRPLQMPIRKSAHGDP
eukprot:966712-Pyramimonas_sp.AAC.1